MPNYEVNVEREWELTPTERVKRLLKEYGVFDMLHPHLEDDLKSVLDKDSDSNRKVNELSFRLKEAKSKDLQDVVQKWFYELGI